MTTSPGATVPLEVLQSMSEMRDALSVLAQANVTDPTIQSVGMTLTKAYGLFEKLVEYVAKKTGKEQDKRYKKPLGESHCVSNLKVLGSEKAEFRV